MSDTKLTELLRPFDYQYEAAMRMASRERFGLHDEMGIGKTPTTIAAIDAIMAERGVVIVPAMLRANWIKEFKRFSPVPRKIVKATSIHDYIAWMNRRFDIMVCSYEHATKWHKDFIKHGEYIDFVAVDEAHYLKNTDSKRSEAILGNYADGMNCIMQYAAYGWHITGTPLAKDPMDAYTFLRFAKSMDMTKEKFAQAFFKTELGAYGPSYKVKDEMVATLQQMLQANSIRRTHDQVGMFLPPIFLQEFLIEGDTAEIFTMLREYPYLEEQIIAAIEAQDLTYLNAAHIATIRRLVGKAKAAAYAPALLAELQSGSSVKRVSFFCHTEPLLFVYNYLLKYGYKPVLAYGDMPDSRRQQSVEQFQNDPTIGPFLGNIRAAGVGLTLTAGSEIDIVESEWVPHANAQAIKRVHRYGQQDTVHGRFVTLADSIDEAVNAKVAQRTAEIAKIEGFRMNASAY